MLQLYDCHPNSVFHDRHYDEQSDTMTHEIIVSSPEETPRFKNILGDLSPNIRNGNYYDNPKLYYLVIKIEDCRSRKLLMEIIAALAKAIKTKYGEIVDLYLKMELSITNPNDTIFNENGLLKFPHDHLLPFLQHYQNIVDIEQDLNGNTSKIRFINDSDRININ